MTVRGKNDPRQNVKSEEMSILELFSRSKRLQQATAAKVVKEIEVINIDATDRELECESNPKFDDTTGLDDGLVCSYSCGQESDDCDGSSCEELSELESFCDEDLLR